MLTWVAVVAIQPRSIQAEWRSAMATPRRKPQGEIPVKKKEILTFSLPGYGRAAFAEAYRNVRLEHSVFVADVEKVKKIIEEFERARSHLANEKYGKRSVAALARPAIDVASKLHEGDRHACFRTRVRLERAVAPFESHQLKYSSFQQRWNPVVLAARRAFARRTHEGLLPLGYRCPLTGKAVARRNLVRIDWPALTDEVRDAMRVSGFSNLPQNLAAVRHLFCPEYQVQNRYYRHRLFSRKGARQVVDRVRHFCLWLMVARHYPCLAKVVETTQSEAGIGSPRTTLNLWAFAWRFRSAGDADYRLRKTIWKARRVLEGFGYPVLFVSGGLAANTLLRHADPRKAGVIAAASCLLGYAPSGYGKAREALTWFARETVADQCKDEEGMQELRRSRMPDLEWGGSARVYRAAVKSARGGYDLHWLVERGEARFLTHRGNTAREALRRSLEEWGHDEEVATLDEELKRFLDEGTEEVLWRREARSILVAQGASWGELFGRTPLMDAEIITVDDLRVLLAGASDSRKWDIFLLVNALWAKTRGKRRPTEYRYCTKR